MKENSEWDLVVKAESSKFDLKFNEVWNYRDLLGLLVKRDFISFYKQTILGPIWFFIQPLFTMGIYVFLFGTIGKFSTDSIPQPLFYLTGIVAWNYFSESLTKTATVFKDNAGIFGKVYFPRLIMPLSIVISNLIRFGVQFLLLAIAIIYYVIKGYHFSPSIYILVFPFLILLMAGQGLGLGMIVSAMTTKYRDLALLLTFSIQLLMYATTVVYPLSSITGSIRPFIEYNPMTPVIEGIRKGLFGQGSFDFYSLGYATAITTIVLIAGTFIFNKVEKNFVDTV